MNYEEMLNQAYEKIPKKEVKAERFEIPKAEIMYQGNQIIIKNFSQIAQTLRRDPKHLLKFLTRELAAPGSANDRAIFQSRIRRDIVQKKIEAYVKEYVLCRECGKPDTKLIKEDRIIFLKCEACGAKSSVRPIK
ncbi:MAG: translation initiation factor IF-2 subunit beta [Candidatus Aenigmatarchaeota archaeon]